MTTDTFIDRLAWGTVFLAGAVALVTFLVAAVAALVSWIGVIP